MCPQCGSARVAPSKDPRIRWGQALAGIALEGDAGAVPAAMGCATCGATWRPSEVQTMASVVQNASGLWLDFARKSHRTYANRLLQHLQTYRERWLTSEMKALEGKTTAETTSTNPGPTSPSWVKRRSRRKRLIQLFHQPWPLRAALRLVASMLTWWLLQAIFKTMDLGGGLLFVVMMVIFPALWAGVLRDFTRWKNTITAHSPEDDLLRAAECLRQQARTCLVHAIQAFTAAHPPQRPPTATKPMPPPPPPPPPPAKAP